MSLDPPNLYTIAERLDTHTGLLQSIQADVKKTSGRVTKLERVWSYAKGVAAAVAAYVAYTGHIHLP